VDFDRDLEFGRAEDLSWALGYVSWGDPDSQLAPDICASAELTLPLEQTWSVVFVACLLRGWLPMDEQACDLIGEFLPSSESKEGRVILDLIASLEASSDPRLNLMPPISGSVWPRLGAWDALSWALSAEDDGLITMPDAVRSFARSTTTDMPPSSRPVAREHLVEFRSKSANALFIMFLAVCYARWDLRTAQSADDCLEDIQLELKARRNDDRLDDFQRGVIRQALEMQAGQFRNIVANAEKLFSEKANPLNKTGARQSLGSP
jgi:hypothetical protein